MANNHVKNPPFELPQESRKRIALSALVTWRASRVWRHKVLRELPGELLSVAGDKSAWQALLPEARELLERLNYYNDLCPFYRQSKVNLNITSAQMKTGLNQRVFDVPASGAFLLTDDRAQGEALFAPGELVSYSCPGEARELAHYYLTHDMEREKIALKSHKRVLERHLYRHRLPKLIELALKA
jgi:spore maturation protein CgeB